MELQLIQLYLWVCLVYDKHPMLKYQRLSNNCQPLFTDQELITVYLFGHLPAEFYATPNLWLYLATFFRLVSRFADLSSLQSADQCFERAFESVGVRVNYKFCRRRWIFHPPRFFDRFDADYVGGQRSVREKQKWRVILLIAAIARAKIFTITE